MQTSSLKKLFFRILKKTDQHEGLLILLCIHLLLRIPNLFEPYWYGDEAIYLTIGEALRQGEILYKEIIDHKTPLIYFFAMLAPTQIWFRIILMTWMTGAICCFFTGLKNIGFSKGQRFVATLVFIIFTTLPWLEGHIPNGELFVIGFMAISFWLFTRIDTIQHFFSLDEENKNAVKKKPVKPSNKLLYFGSGVFAGLAILTKVPAIFDVAGLMVAFLIMLWSMKRVTLLTVRSALLPLIITGFGVITPIVLSGIYYILRGAGREYLDFALLYNFHYAGNWTPPFTNQFLIQIFSLKGKIIVLALSVLLMFVYRRKIKPIHQWLFIWSISALVGTTLSLRPYPHYALQVIPPLAIIMGTFFYKQRAQLSKQLLLGLSVVSISIATFVLLAFRPYSTEKYYLNFFEYMTGKISRQEYHQRFNSFTTDNEIASVILAQSEKPQTFIWGTNPMLYAQSQTVPVGRFTVAFHIQDFPGAFEETMSALREQKPEYIVVMKDESIEFNDFYEFLYGNYIPYKELEHMNIYRLSRFTQLLYR